MSQSNLSALAATVANTGGPAFPATAPGVGPSLTYLGMTLRDWFAGQALAGLMASPHRTGGWEENACGAYAIADAMLAERARAASHG